MFEIITSINYIIWLIFVVCVLFCQKFNYFVRISKNTLHSIIIIIIIFK